jgi:hypothetical protein
MPSSYPGTMHSYVAPLPHCLSLSPLPQPVPQLRHAKLVLQKYLKRELASKSGYLIMNTMNSLSFPHDAHSVVAGRMSDQREQDSNPGGWRKGRFITLAGQHLDLSKNGTSPITQGCGVFMPQNAEASKWEGQSRRGS